MQWLAHHLSAVIIDDITSRRNTQRNDIQHNDTLHKELICAAQHNHHLANITHSITMFCHFAEYPYAECHYAECRYAECRSAQS